MALLSQLDLFGGETPTEELELPRVLAMLAEAERKAGRELDSDEAGALIHERRRRHARDQRCRFCTEDGEEALERLRSRLPPAGARAQEQPSGRPEASSRLTDTPGPGSSGSRSGVRARSTDPPTSHAAARSVGDVTELQGLILSLLGRSPGGMTDEEIAGAFAVFHGGERVSPSGLRTRRAELVERGLIVDTGKTKPLESGRAAIVWALPDPASSVYDREPTP